MRVLLDCRMATWTGVGRYTTGLVRALARRDDVHLVLAVAPGEPAPAEGARVTSVPVEGAPFSLAGMRGLSRAVARATPDLTHCLHFPTPLPAPKALVVTLHDLTPIIVPGVMPSAVKRAVYRSLNRRAAHVADVIVCPSSNTATDVERIFPAARGKTVVTVEAADDFSDGPSAPLVGPLADAASAPYILSMGSTRPHKDIPTLLRAFASLAGERGDIRLLLTGDPVSGYVESVIGDDPARARVFFTGRVSDGELRTLYARAEVFAFPSTYEGFGLPPIEAMAFGAPVVAARAASIPEAVGDAAILVSPGDPKELADALCHVLVDERIREHLIVSGRRRASELTWARTAEATIAVYREVLGRKGTA